MAWDRLCVHKSAGGMGFRRIHEFNIAMLGKQGWRLLTNVSSVVARIFKARYYPNSSFLKAQIGSNPSYIWRSILAVKSLVYNGVRRKIGKGDTVSVWIKPWLPDESNPFVESQASTGLELITMNNLKSVEGRQWDYDLLDDLFNERDK